MDTPRPRWVFVGGMIRSASTLQYQIARALVEEDLGGSGLGYRDAHEIDAYLDAVERDSSIRFPCVVKSHACTPGIRSRLDRGDAVAFYTHRDIRDVVISGSRNFGIPLDEFIAGRLIDQAVGEYRLWTACSRVSVSAFDAITTDPAGWAAEMASFLGVEGVAASRGAELSQRFSLERQRERLRTATLTESGGFDVDPESLLHRNHIDRAATGLWRETLTPGQVREVERRSRDWLVEAGYEPTLHEEEFSTAELLASLRSRTALYFQESDCVLKERQELLERNSHEFDELRSNLSRLEAKLKEAVEQPQPLRRWIHLHLKRRRQP